MITQRSKSKHSNKVSLLLPWSIWLLAVFFYSYEFLQRVSMSVYLPYIMHDLRIDATSAGILGGSFYYAYAIMQLPVGIIVDRLGPKKPALFGLVLIFMGTFSLSHMTMLSVGIISRFVVGAGSAFAFICTMQFIILWFKKRQFALLAGLTNFMGYVGASCGVSPLAIFTVHYGWRATLTATGFIGIVIFLLILIFIKKKQKHISTTLLPRPEKHMLHTLFITMKKPINWVNGLYCTLTVGPTSAFAALWGIKYLTQRNHISTSSAATALTTLFLGVACGSPFWGWFSSYIGKRRLLLVITAFMSAAISATIIINHQIDYSLLYLLCFAFGACQSAHVLCFANARDYNGTHTASAIAFTNMTLILGGAILQPLIGFLNDHLTHNILHSIITLKNTSSLELALLIIPLSQIIAGFLAFSSVKDYNKPHLLYPSILSS